MGDRIITEEEMNAQAEAYKYCPVCGENWEDDYEEHICDPILLVEKEKPRFYMMDLDNYIPEFLQEIILWQDKRFKAYFEKFKVEKK